MVANIATESSLPSRSSSSTEVERAQPADLEGSAPRCPVGTFGGGVEHHHCAVDRGPGAVNVLAKILVVRRVQSTEMSRSLSTAVQSERTRRRSPRALTSPAKQWQFLGQGGLAGVGVRDARKYGPVRNLADQGGHQLVAAVAGMGP